MIHLQQIISRDGRIMRTYCGKWVLSDSGFVTSRKDKCSCVKCKINSLTPDEVMKLYTAVKRGETNNDFDDVS